MSIVDGVFIVDRWLDWPDVIVGRAPAAARPRHGLSSERLYAAHSTRRAPAMECGPHRGMANNRPRFHRNCPSDRHKDFRLIRPDISDSRDEISDLSVHLGCGSIYPQAKSRQARDRRSVALTNNGRRPMDIDGRDRQQCARSTGIHLIDDRARRLPATRVRHVLRGQRRAVQVCARSSRAASMAKYVKIPSAPARLKPSRLSSITRWRSSQPRSAAAHSMAYSPLT